MEGLQLIAAVVSVHLLGSMRPGPNFYICATHGLRYPLQVGLLTSAGVATGALIHTVLGLLGFSAIIAQSPWLYNGLKCISAAYFTYLGVRAMFSRQLESSIDGLCIEPPKQLSHLRAFRIGLLTMLFNPMAAIHFLGLFTMILPSRLPVMTAVTVIITLPTVSWLWFSIVTASFSWVRFRQVYVQFHRWIDIAFGALLIGFSFRIILSSNWSNPE